MRFNLEYRFDASVDDVLAADLDPEYQSRLQGLPNVAERTVTGLDQRPDGTVHRIVRYRFEGNLPGAVKAAIGGSNVSWDEIGDFDPSTNTWRVAIHPHVFHGRFVGRATMRYETEGGGCRRVIDVEVTVKVPIVGGRVEKAIGDGLVETLQAESRILSAYLDERKGAA